MSSFRISDSLSRGLPNGGMPAAPTKRHGWITTEIDLDRLIAIVRLRIEAQEEDDALMRQHAREVLRRWKKRRGWRELHE